MRIYLNKFNISTRTNIKYDQPGIEIINQE